MEKNNIKQDWITEEQWKTVPSVQWWEDQRQGKLYIEQSKPLTTQEVLGQLERLRTSKNWNQGA